MKYSILLFSLATLSFYSCDSSSSTTTSVNPHAQAHNQMHQDHIKEELQKEVNKMKKDISGTYAGSLPCADCEEIIYQLQLNEDLSYRSRVIYKGRSDVPIEKTGTFTISDEFVIQLDHQAGNMNYFKKNGNGLLMLDKDAKVITGDLADKYNLLPIMNMESSEYVKGKKQQMIYKKWKDGIDFYAFGNEPFWSLDMDLDKEIRLKNLDGLDFIAPAVEPISAMDTEVTRYRSVTEAGEIIVQLFHNECIDNMSGEKFYYGVSVDYKPNTAIEYRTYKGCGRFVPDPRLHDIWAIIEVNGTKIIPEEFEKEHPRLEINITEGKVFGHDGCNSFRGGIEVQNEAVIFGNLASTMMACPEMEISTKITKALSGKKLTYKLEENLVFYYEDNKVMVLKHID